MPGYQINSDLKMEALDLAEEIADAINASGADGLSYKQGCELTGLSYDRFYLVVGELVRLGTVKIERSRAGNENRLVFPDQESPANLAITDKQREVLDLLISVMDDEGYACISFAQIAKRTSCRMPSFAIDRLDYKGFLEVLESGRGAWSNLYRVYPNRDGPRGYSWPRPAVSAASQR